VNCRHVEHPSDPAMPAIEKIYTDAFPASERRPISWLHEAAGRTDFAVIVAEINSIVTGFATVFLPNDSGEAALLDYLAVDASHRSTGVGGSLFQSATNIVGNRPILVEVETVGNPPETTRQRRQDFYRRHGCHRIIGVPYILPIPTLGKPLMELMIANAPVELRRTELARWLAAIYTQVYGCDADDPRLGMMLASAPEVLRLD